jgi:hypothetical protein
MNALKKHGLPRRVSAKALTPYLKEEAVRIVGGFSSIGWIDANDYPSEDLKALVEAYGGDDWKGVLFRIVPKTYSFIPGDWADLTSETLRDAFVSYVGRDAEAIKSAETFFLCIATEAGFPIPETFYRRVDRPLAEARRVAKIDESESPEVTDEQVSARPKKPYQNQHFVPNIWVEQILNLTALIDEQDMTNKEKDAVLILLSYLRRREQKERQGNAA